MVGQEGLRQGCTGCMQQSDLVQCLLSKMCGVHLERCLQSVATCTNASYVSTSPSCGAADQMLRLANVGSVLMVACTAGLANCTIAVQVCTHCEAL